MIHRSKSTETVKVYGPGKSHDARDDYDGVVSILWIGSYIAYLHDAHGSNGFDRLEEIIEQLKRDGARIVRAIRCKNHRMPRPWSLVETIEDESVWEFKLVF